MALNISILHVLRHQALSCLKVDKLILPAVPELIETWTSVFGFMPVNESVKKAVKNLNLLVFPGVDILEKSLVKEKITDPIVSSSNGLLAPKLSLLVDFEESKAEESIDNAIEQNCATADVELPSNTVDSCLKVMNVEEGDEETESNLKLLKGSVEEKQHIGKLTNIDVNSLPDEVDQNDQKGRKVMSVGIKLRLLRSQINDPTVTK